jgi:hypothetical protein
VIGGLFYPQPVLFFTQNSLNLKLADNVHTLAKSCCLFSGKQSDMSFQSTGCKAIDRHQGEIWREI